jgi:hypothetical protein
VAFQLTQSSGGWSENVLYNFCSQSNCTDGSNANPCDDPGGCGVLFELPGVASPQDFTLSVSTVGRGKVKSIPAAIECGKICSAAFAPGTGIALRAMPDSAWAFHEWRGACAGKKEHDCHVTMNAAETVTAKFEK